MECVFDEDAFPDAWRINSSDCKISESEKKALVFLNSTQSLELWKKHISSEFFHLMKIPFADKSIIKKMALDFSNEAKGSLFFKKELRRYDLTIFFWGARSACIVQKNTLVNNWTDFFYPSDESSLIFIPNSQKKIFSYEDVFFVGRFSFL